MFFKLSLNGKIIEEINNPYRKAVELVAADGIAQVLCIVLFKLTVKAFADILPHNTKETTLCKLPVINHIHT